MGNTSAQVSYLRTMLEERIGKQQEQILLLLEAAPVQWDARAQQLTHNICEPILQAVDTVQQRLDYIVSLLGEKHRYRLLHEATLQLFNSYMQELFIGRRGYSAIWSGLLPSVAVDWQCCLRPLATAKHA